ncbi:TetR/AcrR family transcriptional regulator [Saccharopolyspora sp. HNM0983]|uniref:TetR/AcrR family transcriptional regulator n=1 Tax=Saccharopolyspora montiporae TaxID=2781240 RepID=A0A929BDB6_9PSEU|nr:TetR/AcrR family transcriptional regulator [Saccharopolyspora sp. HNM0983]MBE9375958.1 TetR/AcrR family transcriptional regulator [Saccharopolyspora sp. HNM0983]
MTWAGSSLQQRRAVRRAKLLDVGRELLGTRGSAAVTVRSVCRQAGLTDRYFYENFADRDELVLAVYESVAAEARSALQSAVAGAPTEDPRTVARAAVDSFLDVLTGDPRAGRILLLEPLTDAALSERGAELMPAFAELVRAQLDERAPELDAAMTATALIGALTNLFIRWLDGSLPADRGRITDYCVELLLAAASLTDRAG